MRIAQSLVGCVRFSIRHLPFVLLVWGFAFAVFFLGFLSGNLHRFPYAPLEEARLATVVAWQKVLSPNRIRELAEWSNISPAEISKHRIEARQPSDDTSAFLLTGGEGQFLEFCPTHGCAAAILDRNGNLIHAYPFRPEELATKRTVDLPYGEIFHDDSKDTAVFGLAPLPNGDLIVVYDFEGTTPLGGGVARIDKDGHLVWYRRDYSDHWPIITPKQEILAISHEIGRTRARVSLPDGFGQDLVCSRGMSLDVVRVLDQDGQVKDEIPVFDAILASPFRTRLLVDTDPATTQIESCYPIHTNSVVPVGAEFAARFADLEPDDLLLSFRNISALGVIGRRDHVLKHLFTGSFIHQHSAQIVTGGNIILFDNFGSSATSGPSRLLLYDPVTGREQVVFPNKHTPRGLNLFSSLFGNINVSEDGSRALFTVGRVGKAYEIGLFNGRLLTIFNNLHDVHSLPQFAGAPKQVRYFTEFGVYYVSPHLAD